MPAAAPATQLAFAPNATANCAGAHHSLRAVPPGLVRPGDMVLLALSTLRHCDHAIDLALEQAAVSRHLSVVYVVDQDLACCLCGEDLGLVMQLRDVGTEAIMAEREREGRHRIEPVVRRALSLGIGVKVELSRGHFGDVCLSALAAERPALIVTTRSARPEWARRLWGSDVDRVAAAASCPLVEA